MPFRDRIETCFAYADTRAYRLPLDVKAENEKWMPCTDRFSRCHRDLPIELIATHLNTCYLSFSPVPVTVHRISEQRGNIPALGVTFDTS